MTTRERENIFTALFKENRDKIYRLCYAYLQDKDFVDDLFQDIMINVWSNLDGFRNEAKITTWVYRIAVNTSLLFNKKIGKSKKIFVELNDEFLSNTNAEECIDSEEHEKLEKLRQVIASLKDQDKLIITLFLENIGYKEIAEIVGITVNHVGVKINRIKSIIEKSMKQNGKQ